MAINYAQIIDGIFIGNAFAARDEEYNIQTIVDLTNNDPLMLGSTFSKYNVLLRDTQYQKKEYAQLDTTTTNVTEYMFRRTINGNILVHCEMGINRSAFIIACYMILCKNYTAVDAIESIRKARKNTLTNNFFVEYLTRLII